MTLASGIILREPGTAFGERWPVTTFALVIATFLFYTHRSNIRNFIENGSDDTTDRAGTDGTDGTDEEVTQG